MAACSKKHDYKETVADRGQAVDEATAVGIGDRLYKAHTVSWAGTCSPTPGEDTICRKDVDPNKVSERLYTTETHSRLASADAGAFATDTISAKPVNEDELQSIVDRLHSTQTESTRGPGPEKKMTTNAVAREPATDEEMKEIFNRLGGTHTKSSSGAEACKIMEPLKPAGYGLKMYPVIEGIEERFVGKPVTPEKVTEVSERLQTTQTTASQAKCDQPRILLYPERTTLMNNFERIKQYQETGVIVRQAALARREKWYN